MTSTYDRLSEIVLERKALDDDGLYGIIDALPDKTIDPEYNSLRAVVLDLIQAEAPADQVLPRVEELYDRINSIAIEMRHFLEGLEAVPDLGDATIETDPAQVKAIDKLRAAVDSERVTATLRDLLDEGGPLAADQFTDQADEIRQAGDEIQSRIDELQDKVTDIDDQATAVEAVAEAAGLALDAFDAWQNAEGREDKRDAREELLSALTELVESYEAMEADG
jgi:hypothetical protein